MDNAQKAIMIGVGLFITIIIISAVMLITSAGQDMVDESMNKLSEISNQLSSSEKNALDGKYMNGSQVISYIKKYHNSTSFACYYQSSNGTLVKASQLTGDKVSASSYVDNTKIEVKSLTGTDLDKIGDLTNNGVSGKYVSASASYQAQLIKMSTGDIVGVIFLKR